MLEAFYHTAVFCYSISMPLKYDIIMNGYSFCQVCKQIWKILVFGMHKFGWLLDQMCKLTAYKSGALSQVCRTQQLLDYVSISFNEVQECSFYRPCNTTEHFLIFLKQMVFTCLLHMAQVVNVCPRTLCIGYRELFSGLSANSISGAHGNT